MTDTFEGAVYADVHGAPYPETPRRAETFAGTQSVPRLIFAVRSTAEAGALIAERTIGFEYLTSSGRGTAVYRPKGGCWASNEQEPRW